MPHYYFNTRDNDEFDEDDIGLTFPDLETCKIEAAGSLAEMARDVVPGSDRRELAVEVQDHLRRPLLEVRLIFEILILGEGLAPA